MAGTSRPTVLDTTDIGPAGVDVRSDGANLWVVSYEAAAEPRATRSPARSYGSRRTVP